MTFQELVRFAKVSTLLNKYGSLKFSLVIIENKITLVGQVFGRRVKEKNLQKWSIDVWKDVVEICPRVFILPQGWIVF